MKKAALLAIIILSNLVHAADTAPLTLEWSQPLSSGVQRIEVFNLTSLGGPSVYAMSIGTNRATVHVYDFYGRPQYDTELQRYGLADYGSEDFLIGAVADLDGNGYLDMVYGTEIRATSINNHRLYRAQRIPEEGLERLYNRMTWVVKDTGRITGLVIADVNDDAIDEIVTSSVDQRIRAYDIEGEPILNITLDGSVWDVALANVDNDTRPEYLAAAFRGLYLIDDNGNVLWVKPSETRYQKSYSVDMDSDGLPELTGVSGDTLYVYNTTGALLWSYVMPGITDITSMGVYGYQEKYLIAADDRKIAFLDKSGSIKWEFEVQGRISALRQFEYGGGKYLLVGTEEGIQSYKLDESGLKSADAKTQYNMALDAYKRGDFNLSAYYARAAERTYAEMLLAEGELESSELESKASQLYAAHLEYSLAEEDYRLGRYNQSMSRLRGALDVFRRLNYTEGVNSSSELMASSERKAAEKEVYDEGYKKAEAYYSAAESYYVNGSCADSTRYARMALEEYTRLNDAAGAKLSETLLSMNSGCAGTTTTTRTRPTTTTVGRGGKAALTTENIITFGALLLAAAILLSAILSKLKRR